MLLNESQAIEVRERCDITRDLAARDVTGSPVLIPAGHVVFAILDPAIGESDRIRFTWGSVGHIWHQAPREIFLRSIRR